MKGMIWFTQHWFIAEEPPKGHSMIIALFFPVVPSAMTIIYTQTFTTIRNLCLLPDNDDYCSFVVICSQRRIHFSRATWFMADIANLCQLFPVVQEDPSGEVKCSSTYMQLLLYRIKVCFAAWYREQGIRFKSHSALMWGHVLFGGNVICYTVIGLAFICILF